MIIRSDSGNNYYCSPQGNKLLYVHPKLIAIHDSESKDNLPDELAYYKSKDQWLKKHHYFNDDIDENFLDREMDGDIVKSLVYNANRICFEVTESCNLKCKYCAYGDLYQDQKTRENKWLDFEVAKAFLEDYFSAGIFRPKVNFSFYGGEPLLNFPLIEKIVNYVVGHKNRPEVVTFSMTSNGVLLDRYIDFIVQNDFKLDISLDGDVEGNGYRVFSNGQNSFDTVYKNVCIVKDRYPDYFNSKVYFMSVLHRKNSVNSIASFFEKEFDTESRISSLSTTFIKDSEVDTFNQMYRNYSESLYACDCDHILKTKVANNLDDLSAFVRSNTDVVFHKYLNIMDENAGAKLPTATCLPFSKKLFITAKGNILPCERIGLHRSFGKVSEAGVDIDFDGVAKRYNLIYDKVRDQCKKCARVFNCNQCLLYNGVDESSDFTCEGFSDSNQQGKYLSGIFNVFENNPTWYKQIIEEHIYE